MTVILEAADPAEARRVARAVCGMVSLAGHGPCWPRVIVRRPPPERLF